MEEIKALLEDIKEAQRQDNFTHEARNWLSGFRQRVETFLEAQNIENAAREK